MLFPDLISFYLFVFSKSEGKWKKDIVKLLLWDLSAINMPYILYKVADCI